MLLAPPDLEAARGQTTTPVVGAGPVQADSSLVFTFDGTAVSRGESAPPGLRLEMPSLGLVDPAVRAAVEEGLFGFAAKVGVGLDPAVEETSPPTAPPATPWETPDLHMADPVQVTQLGGVSLVDEEHEGYEFDSYEGVFHKVKRGEKYSRADILRAYRELLVEHDIHGDDHSVLVARLGEMMMKTWKRKGPAKKVRAAAMYEVHRAAKEGIVELRAFADEGHERALRASAEWKRQRSKESCSYRPGAMVRTYRDSKTGRWTERMMPAPCRHESCPRCAAVKAREGRERLLLQEEDDRRRGAPWMVKLVLTTAPPEDGHELAQVVRLSREFEKVTAALRKWLGKDIEVFAVAEFKPRFHVNVLVRGQGVMLALLRAAIETSSLPAGATEADLLELAQADLGKRDGHGHPLFHRRIRPVVNTLRELVTRLGWGKEVSIRPMLLAPGETRPEADIKETMKSSQRAGALIPIGSRTTRATAGWWSPHLKGQDWKRKAKAVREEDAEIAAGTAPYAQPWEKQEVHAEGDGGGLVSSTAGSRPTPTLADVSVASPPPVRAQKTARKTVEVKQEFPRSRQGCPGRRKTDVAQDRYSVRDLRAWRATQTARTGVQYGAVITNGARILSVWAELRLLDSPWAQLQRAVEVGWHLTCYMPEPARRREMRAQLRRLQQYALSQPSRPPPRAGPTTENSVTAAVHLA